MAIGRISSETFVTHIGLNSYLTFNPPLLMHPKFLDKFNCESKGENNERKKS
jgi:hypothetical protein